MVATPKDVNLAHQSVVRGRRRLKVRMHLEVGPGEIHGRLKWPAHIDHRTFRSVKIEVLDRFTVAGAPWVHLVTPEGTGGRSNPSIEI